MMTQYDLEQRINDTHNFVDHLNDISYGILEVGMTNDEVVNAVDGLAVMLKIHTEKMFDLYKRAFHLDEYKDNLK